jgi:hypothetical protein
MHVAANWTGILESGASFGHNFQVVFDLVSEPEADAFARVYLPDFKVNLKTGHVFVFVECGGVSCRNKRFKTIHLIQR